ncbi:hypothetical protein SEA_ALONE_213 [Streptomyces phage Alone3]|nr:hypothetical protein SEA_ALONE_213 [Streptomyces phage Alone3]
MDQILSIGLDNGGHYVVKDASDTPVFTSGDIQEVMEYIRDEIEAY